jgi:primosomal protein N' (replication factor Y)
VHAGAGQPTHLDLRSEFTTYAQVIVDVPTRALAEPFDYAVPDDLPDEVAPGCTVVVPLGSRFVGGYVVGLSDTTEVAATKPIAQVLTPPLFPKWAPAIAAWIAQEYVAPISEALRLFLPPGGVPEVAPTDDGGWTLTTPTLGPATERVAELIDPQFQPRSNAYAQRAVLDALAEGAVTVSLLKASLGSIDSALKRLEELGAIRIDTRQRRRAPSALARVDNEVTLTDEQARAVDALTSAAPTTHPVLIDGVTGSGKTEVYMRVIESYLERGRGSIMLVPEIALTPQTVGRFRARFGDRIAVLHSRLSAGERYDEWWRLHRGEATIAIGPRSALFSPVPDLGVIILDESHDGSYKQGSSPRYHARDVAFRMAEETGAALALGSATPSLETLHAADAGRIDVSPLTRRVAGGTLPPVRVVDMGVEFREGHRSMFSRPLLAALEEVAERGEKAVLLLNRRGFASFLLCRECGFVPECEHCSVSLTAHKSGTVLTCHHCGHTISPPVECPECGSVYLLQFGAGTERVQQELAEALPAIASVRMDADTTRRKGGHELRLAEFEALESGVLIGTQMVAKGLDYPDVTLVGVLDADTGLRLPDFRAGERTFQLLSQVSGRAGRGESPGRVIVQTYWPDSYAVRAAAAHDREIFAAAELPLRQELNYPPFGRLARLLISGENRTAVREHAIALATHLEESVPADWTILGPTDAVIARLKNVYRYQVLVRTPETAAVGGALASAMSAIPSPEGVRASPDVDAYDLM